METADVLEKLRRAAWVTLRAPQPEKLENENPIVVHTMGFFAAFRRFIRWISAIRPYQYARSSGA